MIADGLRGGMRRGHGKGAGYPGLPPFRNTMEDSDSEEEETIESDGGAGLPPSPELPPAQ